MSDLQNEKVVEQEEIITKPPPKYTVIFFNDDFTPFEFVVALLMKVFHKNSEESVALATQIHHKDSSVVGIYTKEIAETKTEMSLLACQLAEVPLKIVIKKE